MVNSWTCSPIRSGPGRILYTNGGLKKRDMMHSEDYQEKTVQYFCLAKCGKIRCKRKCRGQLKVKKKWIWWFGIFDKNFDNKCLVTFANACPPLFLSLVNFLSLWSVDSEKTPRDKISSLISATVIVIPKDFYPLKCNHRLCKFIPPKW